MHATETTTENALFRVKATVITPPAEPFLPPHAPPKFRRHLWAKRLLDISLSITMMVLSAPVVALCAVIIKLTSRGPAFYSQQRVGQFGRVFTIYKLRTMHHNCDKLTGPQWCVPGDPRVTLFGRFLRAAHLDELPQLINVLRGQMSLVGPRPERPEIAAKLATQVDSYDVRSAMLPGITGHAQVHLPPDVTVNDVRDKVQLDREYMRSWTVWSDVVALWRTARKVVGLKPKQVKR